MDPEKAPATAAEFILTVDQSETSIAQQVADANKKYLALRPSCLNATSSAPVFVKIQELQETFEKQLKSGTESSMRKLHELCEMQKSEYSELYQKERARLLKILSK
jgi:hypothetical protein